MSVRFIAHYLEAAPTAPTEGPSRLLGSGIIGWGSRIGGLILGLLSGAFHAR